MSKFWVLLLLSQCAHIVKCFDDPHMCIKDVEVSYTVTERVPLDAYEDFESVLRDLDVQGEMILVTKTKLEPREVCCDGYQRSEVEGEGCQPVPIVIPEEQDPIADAVDPSAMVSKSSELNKLYIPLMCAISIVFNL